MQLLEPVIIQKLSIHLESGKLGCFPGVAVERNWVCVKLQDSWYFSWGVNLSGFDDHFLHSLATANEEGLKLSKDSETFQVVNTSLQQVIVKETLSQEKGRRD